MKRLLDLELILLGLFVIAAVILTQDPFGWASQPTPKPTPTHAHCWHIPAKWGGGTYCSDEKLGGRHGYLNPGSNEWEVE